MAAPARTHCSGYRFMCDLALTPAILGHMLAIRTMELIMNITSIQTDINLRRNQASQHIEQGALTAGYTANVSEVVMLLNQALATEIVCVLRYRANHFMARGIHAKNVAIEFLAHSNEEQEHADLIAGRIVQLGGTPNLAPDNLLELSHVEYIIGESLVDMIKENLIAERIAIDSYRELIHYLGDKDPTTSLMLKEILTTEEAHADELADLLEGLPVTDLTKHSQD
jgi:bacterioferritin